MNVQPMTLDINSLRAPQKSASVQMSTKKEDSFSSVLEKSKQEQDITSKEKTNSAKDDAAKKSKEKVETDSKVPVTKEANKIDDTKLEELSAEEKEAKLMKKIAQLLDITIGELESMLATLQMELTDLLQGDNMQKLIMQAYNVNEPMDLLLIPEVASKIKAVSVAVESYVATTLTADSDVALLKATEKMDLNVEIIPKLETQNLSTKEQVDQVKEINIGSKSTEQDADTKLAVNVNEMADEGLSQSEEQFTSHQNNASNQFLDHLTQSMGEVLQTKNSQINEVFETVMPRAEVLSPKIVLDQIVDKIKVSAIENEAIMNIQLKPEHLGKLSMEVVSKQGIMTAQITVENEKTKVMLEQNIQSLKENLEDKGLVIQELEVAIGHNQSESNQTYEAPRTNKNISDIISSMMEEDIIEEETKQDNIFDDANEVDFIA